MRKVGVCDDRAIRETNAALLDCKSVHELTTVGMRKVEWLLGADSSCVALTYLADSAQPLHRLSGFGRVSTQEMLDCSARCRQCDPVLRALLSSPWDVNETLVTLEKLVSMRSYLSTEFYNEFLRPRGIYYILGISVAVNSDTRTLMCLHLPASAAPGFGQRHIDVVTATLSSIAAAFAAAMLREVIADRDAAIHALCRMGPRSGVLLLDNALRVVMADEAARGYLRMMHCEEGSRRVAELALPPRHKLRLQTLTNAWNGRAGHRVINPSETGRHQRIPRFTVTMLDRNAGRAKYLLSFEHEMPSERRFLRERGRPLSAREAQLAELAARGMTNNAIAGRLQLSIRTVENHLRQIYRKLEVPNRTALAHLLAVSVAAGSSGAETGA
ncbi:MAG: helix-turn-helix transcriptional regulator [Gammaproteobacteria bacterium]